MKNGTNPFFNYTAYKKDMLNLFEEALKDTKKDIAEIKKATLKNTLDIKDTKKDITEIKKATLKHTTDISEIKKILTNHLNHEHKAINQKLDKILKSINSVKK